MCVFRCVSIEGDCVFSHSLAHNISLIMCYGRCWVLCLQNKMHWIVNGVLYLQTTLCLQVNGGEWTFKPNCDISFWTPNVNLLVSPVEVSLNHRHQIISVWNFLTIHPVVSVGVLFRIVFFSLVFIAECWKLRIPTEWPHRTSALCLGRRWCARRGTTATWRWIWFTRTRRWSSSSANSTTSLEGEAPLDLFRTGLRVCVCVCGGGGSCRSDESTSSVAFVLFACWLIWCKMDFTSKDNYGVKRNQDRKLLIMTSGLHIKPCENNNSKTSQLLAAILVPLPANVEPSPAVLYCVNRLSLFLHVSDVIMTNKKP